ncbi:MAG TPA: ABC transporter permease DevC [Pirellulales bacterium]|nr:ABC transporter permease DevC [Pirellulales bacterium]
MKTPLAWLNLLHEKTRTLVAIAGVAFAVVLILMQLGFFFSVEQTATQIYDRLDFDILITSPQYQSISKTGTFSRTRLFQAASTPGVSDAHPLYLDFNLWLTPGDEHEHRSRRGIFVIGFPLDQRPLHLPKLKGDYAQLKQPGNVFMDKLSRKQFGDWQDHPDKLQIGGKKIKIVGTFEMGTGFGADGDVVVGEPTFLDFYPNRTAADVSLGLVRKKPGVDVNQLCQELKRRLPLDVLVYTRRDIETKERKHWVVRTSVGVIFSLGVVIGFIVGVAIVYQVLSSDIANHQAEYATLKAMGYPSRYLSRVVLQQAIAFAVFGYLPGWAISCSLYMLTEQKEHIPMKMSLGLTVTILALTIVMCAVSGLASLRKINAADPAELFNKK